MATPHANANPALDTVQSEVSTPSGQETGPAYKTGAADPAVHDETMADAATASPPRSSFATVHRTEVGRAAVLPRRPSQARTSDPSAASTGCRTDELRKASGVVLADRVESLPASCLNTLFDLDSADTAATFSDPDMLAVATRLRDRAKHQKHADQAKLVASILYLRAGYYARHQHRENAEAVGDRATHIVDTALRNVLDKQRLRHVSNANGEVLTEAVTLVDSASLNSRYLDAVQTVLSNYRPRYDSSRWMLAAVNSTFTVLYGGHDVPGFNAAITASPALVRTLSRFARHNIDQLDGPRSYLPVNAARELARFLSEDKTRASVRPAVRDLLASTTAKGSTAPLWVGAAEMVHAYDNAKCGYYRTCDFSARVAAAVAKTTYTCSSSIVIKAQSMTSSEFASTCSSLRNQDAYFHSVARDPGPVANDYNTRIEVVVYDSSTDYQTYAGAEYGISTNNGGMYLEGDPAAAGNQARFIAYEAEWLRPQFAIWNLNHEYTHYLDGRFNMYGDFNAGVSTPTIWWIEGFAEYISYSYRNVAYTDAQTEASYGTYTLRTLFDTTYSNDSTRIYRWGYLAAAFMVNKHPNELATVLGYYRTGNWAAARSYLTSSIGTRYDGEFRTFLSECAAGNCSGGGGTGNTPPNASFTNTTTGLTVAFTDTSTDPDGSIASRSWSFGDGTSSTSANPSKTYTSAGSYTVTLTVTDNQGAKNTATKTVTVGGGGSALPECTDPDVRKLDRGCQRSARNATAGNNDYLFIYVPSGVAQLRVATTGGTGDADLYYSPTTWATPTNYTQQSSGAGNNESLTVTNPPPGYHYITLNAATTFTNVTVSVQ